MHEFNQLRASDLSAVERLSALRRVCYETFYSAFSFQISAYSHFSNSVEWWPYGTGIGKILL